MSSFRDEYYSKVDSIFENTRNNPFRDTLDPTPQENPSPGLIEPAAWVENPDQTVVINSDGITITDGKLSVKNSSADDTIVDGVPQKVVNSTAAVTIDENGITIADGALTLNDNFGENVITGAGFGASWYDFITKGVYNSTFAAGPIQGLAVSETGGGDTTAEYEASLSSAIPYWVVSSKTGTVEHATDATASSGKVVSLSGSTFVLTFYQDVPVTPGQTYAVIMNWKHNANSTRTFSVTASIQPVDADHLPFSTEVSQSLVYSSGALSDYELQLMVAGTEMPPSARYARVTLSFTRLSGGPTISIAAVELNALRRFGPQIINGGTLQFDDSMGPAWDDGVTGVDVVLRRTGTREVSLQNDFGNLTTLKAGKIRATSSSDAEQASTDHGLQIGPDGNCLKIDGNEIISVGSDLLLNNDATNDVVLFGSTSNEIRFDKSKGSIVLLESTSVPLAPTNGARIYARDNGSGKTQLVVRFQTGGGVVIATEA